MSESSGKRKVNYLSLANVISSFAVVVLHTNGCFWKFSKERYWITANIIESVMYFAVPVFFMITGVTLMNYRERYTLKQYAKKRIQKTVIPFFIWSILGIFYLIANDAWVLDLSWSGIQDMFLRIINMDVISIYWFFGALFSVYLSIPLFGSIEKEVRIKVFTYIIAVTFFFNILLPFLSNVLHFSYVSKVTVPVGSSYILYVLLGYVLHNISFSKIQRGVLYLLSVIGLLMHILGTQILSFRAGEVDVTYKDYLNVPCVLYSIGVFVLFKELGERIKSPKLWSILHRISNYTFAVYLLHWFIRDTIEREWDVNIYSISYRIGAPILIYILCVVFTWGIRKIPVVKNILP